MASVVQLFEVGLEPIQTNANLGDVSGRAEGHSALLDPYGSEVPSPLVDVLEELATAVPGTKYPAQLRSWLPASHGYAIELRRCCNAAGRAPQARWR